MCFVRHTTIVGTTWPSFADNANNKYSLTLDTCASTYNTFHNKTIASFNNTHLFPNNPPHLEYIKTHMHCVGLHEYIKMAPTRRNRFGSNIYNTSRWFEGGCDGQLGVAADGIMSSAMQMCFPVEHQPPTQHNAPQHSFNKCAPIVSVK